ncbi:MAG: TRAP transporter small permease [Dehalococcoidia bacterium]|nr:MAG: TRAP transporter small permease [Dehalococcoidia bacterium]UCG82610.1 MAG: TRAP transporter small permease [Dehalococcoidia bacterium]
MLRFIIRILDVFPAWVERATLLASVLMLIGMAGIMFLSTIFRYLLDSPWKWSEEALVYMLAWSIFILMGSVARQYGHVRISFFIDRIMGSPDKAQRLSNVMENIIGLGIGIFLAYSAFRWMNFSREMGAIVWSAAGFTYAQWLTRIVPTLGLCLLSFFYLERSIRMLLAVAISRRQVETNHEGDTQPS